MKTVILTLFLLFNFQSAYSFVRDSTARDTVRIRINPIEELRSDLKALVDNPDLSDASIGISVLSVESGKYLYRLNDNKNFVPASNQKIITVYSAIDFLGEDFVFTTKIYLDGTLEKNGEFIGNIIIRGFGDPTLSLSYGVNPGDIISSWVDSLINYGIRSVRGNIIGDDNYFDEVPYGPGWAWDDMKYPFSPMISSLSIWDNIISIYISPGDTVSESARITIEPQTNFVRVINNVMTGSISSLEDINFFREQGTNIIELSGNITEDSLNPDKTILVSVTVDNPTAFFVNLFREALEERNIRVRGASIDIDEWHGRLNYPALSPIIISESTPLREIIKTINKYSHNLSAELVFRAFAKESSGSGSSEAGSESIKNYLKEKGISPNNMNIADGSGLSRYNLISPSYIVTILSSIYRSSVKEPIFSSFARPGEEGTLKRRMTKSRAENNVVAKTGSMNGISALAGFIRTRDNELLAFSIMINNFTAPSSVANNLEDLICMRLASFSRK